MKLKDKIIFIVVALLLVACEHAHISSSDRITIYYENGNVDDSGYSYHDFSNTEKVNPTIFRDMGIKRIDSIVFYSFCKSLASAHYTRNQKESLQWSGDYKMFIDVKTDFSDSLILNRGNVFYSVGKNKGAELDSLAYVIRNVIDYFDVFKAEELSLFKEFERYKQDVDYHYKDIDNNSLPPTLYTKIILIPDNQ